MQDHSGAPGSARPGNTGTAVPAACGGAAVQSQPQAWDHIRPRAVPMPMAPDHIRSSAAPMLKAPGHIRPGAASMPPALGHNRPRATSMAPQGHADGGLASAGPSVPMTTAPVPACVSRSLQEFLPRVPATPRTYPVHPAIQVPIRPPPATAGTGFPRQRHSRAPPTAAGRKPTLVRGQRAQRGQRGRGVRRRPG